MSTPEERRDALLEELGNIATTTSESINIDLLPDDIIDDDVIDAISQLQVTEAFYINRNGINLISYEITEDYIDDTHHVEKLVKKPNNFWLYICRELWQQGYVTKLLNSFGQNLDLSDFNPSIEVREAMFTIPIRCLAVTHFSEDINYLISLNTGIIKVFSHSSLLGAKVDGTMLVHGLGERQLKQITTMDVAVSKEDYSLLCYLFPRIKRCETKGA